MLNKKWGRKDSRVPELVMLWWYIHSDQYQSRGEESLIRTHFQSRGKNSAPVPNLCTSELSGGSPCYDTCKGKVTQISVNEGVVLHCCIHNTSHLLCFTALVPVWTHWCSRCAQRSPRTHPQCVFPVPGRQPPRCETKKSPINKRTQFGFSALLTFFPEIMSIKW